MTGTAILFFLIGLLIGGITFWFIAASRFHRTASQLEGRASSAEAVIGELRQQNTEKEAEVERLRNELISERQAKIEAVTKLELSEKRFKEEMERFEKIRSELSETFKALSLDALTKNTGEFKKYADEFI